MSFKRSFIGMAVAVIAFAGLASGAKAVPVVVDPGVIPGGVLENGETTVFGTSVIGEFAHQWNIVLEGLGPTASNTILDVILENTNTNPFLNIAGLRLELFAGIAPGGGSPQPLGSGIAPVVGPISTAVVPGMPPTAPNSGSIMIPIFGGSLSPGNYYFQVTGFGIGANPPQQYTPGVETGNVAGQGFYNVTVTATPIPAAIWLMISALLGLVSFSRIRRRSGKTA